MQDDRNFDPQKAKQELLEFYQFFPSLNFDALEQGEYNDALKHYYEVGSALASTEPSPLAHYILASLHCIGGKAPYYDLEKAKEERRQAGYLGHGIAMYDYGRQVNYSNDESLAFLQILVEEKASVAGIMEEHEYLMNKLDDDQKERIEALVTEIRHNYEFKGLRFVFD